MDAPGPFEAPISCLRGLHRDKRRRSRADTGEPQDWTSPKVKMPPSAATSERPSPFKRKGPRLGFHRVLIPGMRAPHRSCSWPAADTSDGREAPPIAGRDGSRSDMTPVAHRVT